MKTQCNRLLSILTVMCLLGSYLPASALASSEAGGHLPDCRLSCDHTHNEACGYAEAVEGQSCGHIHNDTCGYFEGTPGTSCPNAGDCTGEEDGHVEPSEELPGSPCEHEHDDDCGYAQAVEVQPCGHVHDDACQVWDCAEGCPLAAGQAEEDNGASTPELDNDPPPQTEPTVSPDETPDTLVGLEGIDDANSPDLSSGPIHVQKGTYTQSGETIPYEGILTITQSEDVTENCIEISGPAQVELSGVQIQAKAASAISIAGGAVELFLTGDNTAIGGTGANGYGKAGVYVAPHADLVIDGDGSLTALGGYHIHSNGNAEYGACGIGYDYLYRTKPESGSVTILGGTVTARGHVGGFGNTGSGISGSEINIEGGVVTAYGYQEEGRPGSSEGTAIGGNATSVINITDGEVHAYGGSQGAGIGAATVTISGGTIEACGGTQGAGVGGFFGHGSATQVTISGGGVNAVGGNGGPGVGAVGSYEGSFVEIIGTASVTAVGGLEAAGVGCGVRTNPKTGITIHIGGAADVEATGGDTPEKGSIDGAGAGIGNAGYSTAPASIVIDTTGTVKAQGGTNQNNKINGGAGIGGAENSGGGNISIASGSITAIGGAGAAGIGGGARGTSGMISITGGTVNATGFGSGAGIGSGSNGDVDRISIGGGDITAAGGEYGAGIGSGFNGDIGTIEISGGSVNAASALPYEGRGAGIGGGQKNGTGMISLTGGDIYAVSAYMFSTAAIGGGYAGASANVMIGEAANVWAFNYSYGVNSYAAKPAVDQLAADSTAALVSGVFHPDHAFGGTVTLDGRSVPAAEYYYGFAATVSGQGSYELTSTAGSVPMVAVSGSGPDAVTALSTGVSYKDLYWTKQPEQGEAFLPTAPDPFTPDDSWMDDYTGGAVYDPETGTTTITGSITDGIFLYIIPAGTQGTVVLDGTGYINALIHRYTGSSGVYWNPGSYSGSLPIKVVNRSDLEYSYSNASFGIDESAAADDAYFIGGQLNRPSSVGDKLILRTPAQPLMNLYGKSTSDRITVEELLHAEEQIAALGIEGVNSYADYAVYYYREVLQYPGAENAQTVSDLPLACKLNIMGYASPMFDTQDKLKLGNTGVILSEAAAEALLGGLSDSELQRIVTGDPYHGKTTVCVAETDPELQSMGYEVLYTLGIAFTFDGGMDDIVSGDSVSSEAFNRFVNEGLGWLTLSRTDFGKQALAGSGLSEAQKSVAATVGTLTLKPGGEQNIERAMLSMPGYAIPNAMFSTAGLRGLTMNIALAPADRPAAQYSLTVNYLHGNTGATLAQSYTSRQAALTQYDLSAQTALSITGYTRDRVVGVTSGVLESDVVVNVYYLPASSGGTDHPSNPGTPGQPDKPGPDPDEPGVPTVPDGEPTPDVPIPDEDIPLGDIPVVDIPLQDIPLGDIPLGDIPNPGDIPDDGITIVDENIPFGDLPQTGTTGGRHQKSAAAALLLSLISLSGAIVFFASGKKRKDENTL